MNKQGIYNPLDKLKNYIENKTGLTLYKPIEHIPNIKDIYTGTRNTIKSIFSAK